MFNLFDMLQQSQNGSAIDNVAQQFGLTPRQAENAVDVLLPAFTLALQRQMQNPQVWPTLLSAMQPPAPTPAPQAFEAAGRAFAHDSMRQGADLMQSLFGSSDLSKQVAAQAAAASGLPATIMQQMMPALGSMLASGMLKTFSQEGLAGVITAMQRGVPGAALPTPVAQAATPFAGNPFAATLAMMAQMMGGGLAHPASAKAEPEPEPEPEPETGTAALPNPFNPQEMSAYFTRMLDAAAAGAQALAVHAPEPEAPRVDEQEAAPAPVEEPGESAASNAAVDNPLAMMFETGRDVQEHYLRSLRDLFDRSPSTPGTG